VVYLFVKNFLPKQIVLIFCPKQKYFLSKIKYFLSAF
jgi:hypothetical protein